MYYFGFTTQITHIGSWKNGYASIWFKDCKLKIIPEEIGLIKKLKNSDGTSRIPYSKHKKGKPKHASKLWLLNDTIIKDGFHKVDIKDYYKSYKINNNGITLYSTRNDILTLNCVSSIRFPKPVKIIYLQGDPYCDDCRGGCSKRKLAKRCENGMCGFCCKSNCKFHNN